MKGFPSRPTTSKTTIGNRVREKGTATEKSIRQLSSLSALWAQASETADWTVQAVAAE